MSQPVTARTSVKLHRNVSLIETADAPLAEELLARKGLARLIVGRLSETSLLVQAGHDDEVVLELRRMGHAPRVVR